MRYSVSPQDMRALEKNAFAAGLNELLVMERAAACVTDALVELLGTPAQGKTVLFVCGKGNNGGDGLAAARLFALRGGISLIAMPREPATENARVMATACTAMGLRFVGLEDAAACPLDAAVDALYGIGFQGAIGADSPEGAWIALLRERAVPVVAVDVPSGMDAGTGAVEGPCVSAAVTVTFQYAKHGLYLTRHRQAVGRVVVADIGLTYGEGLREQAQKLEAGGYQVADPEDLPHLLPPVSMDAHKGTMGRITQYVGSFGMAGAAAMAGKACLRAGGGMVTLVCDPVVISILQAMLPNALCRDRDQPFSLLPERNAILFGCGTLEGGREWRDILALFDPAQKSVWDAGALNLLSRHPMPLGAQAIITPHVAEAARLLQTDRAAILRDMVGAARALREKYQCGTVVIKGATTVICGGERIALHVHGTPALAKGGSGDALAGILSALYVHLPPFEAARCACLWHGLAARAAEKQWGVRGTLTGDVTDCLGRAAEHPEL